MFVPFAFTQIDSSKSTAENTGSTINSEIPVYDFEQLE
jgi:hypothetical protein